MKQTILNKRLSLIHLIKYICKRILLGKSTKVILPPVTFTVEGHEMTAIVSYINESFYKSPDDIWLRGHSNRSQIFEIKDILVELGFNVIIADQDDLSFDYSGRIDLLLGQGQVFTRLLKTNSAKLNVYYSTTQGPRHLNEAIKTSFLRARAKNKLLIRRPIYDNTEEPSVGVDAVFYFGNDYIKRGLNKRFPKSQNRYYQVKNGLNRITTKEFKGRDRNTFLYLGSWGSLFRGLDMVLEAFSIREDFKLIVCNNVEEDTSFALSYVKQLFFTKNIFTLGFVDVASDLFLDIMSTAMFQIYPTGSDAASSSVTLGMRHGLIPVISKECSVDTFQQGIELVENDFDNIVESLDFIKTLPYSELAKRSQILIEKSEENYSLEAFKKSIKDGVLKIISE